MEILEGFDQFVSKKKQIKAQKKQIKQKLNDLNNQNLKIKIDQSNQKEQDLKKRFNTFVAGSSNY